MTLDERCTQIITMLLNADTYVSIDRLTSQLRVSKRTVYYDVQKINTWLDEYKLDPVKRKYGKGYFLEEESRKVASRLIGKISNFQYIYSQEERIILIAFKLLTSESDVFMEDLMELTMVSRATVSNDLKQIKQFFLNENLKVNFLRYTGYKVNGKEENKRKLLVNYLTEIMTTKKEWNILIDKQIQLLFHENDLEMKDFSHHINRMMIITEECEKELSIELTDEMVHLLALKLLVIVKRLKLGHRIQVDADQQVVLRSTKEYQAAKNIAKKLQRAYNLQIPSNEIGFITMNLLGSKVNYFELEHNQSQEMKRLYLTVKGIVQDFQNYACVLFQEVEQLEVSLFKHLKPAYYRVKYNVSLRDGNSESVQREFPEIFKLTKKSIGRFEELLGAPINDSEVAYIAMHLGGWLQREGKKPVQRKKALIVCENGIGTSNILWGQLEKLVAAVDITGCVSRRQYESKEYEVDLVFATSSVNKKRHPVLIVNPILTDLDKEAVLSFVNNLSEFSKDQQMATPTLQAIMNIVRKYTSVIHEKELIQELSSLLTLDDSTTEIREERPVLNELLTKETIQNQSKVDNWKEAIRLASEPLLMNGSITEEYVDAMIANVEELGPYVVIAPDIALPHARPECGVQKIGMSLLRLEESVYFSENEKHRARLIVVLAAEDNEKHLKALSQLSTMFSDEGVLENLINSNNKEDIMKCINKYSAM
ncbi:BglG family transcription antiterminator [Aquibacillus salsiterrae]|uniref:BglG family transcription antiterminator n=1 Tax=Aquibacillus salsiterrae TaxID=2950439 RepID=A0A9X4AG01_9BACI|nr:BglG family transcription antiterminator [Aquibacillus salsiterrae]MDC3418552.1 BglG family transcription antiterminator [Aquibacillus salsiterrae]